MKSQNRKKVHAADAPNQRASKSSANNHPARRVDGARSHKRGDHASQQSASHKDARKNHFPIVGVGASAGGLEAFSELLKHLPGDTGLGFVLVQHLDPEHESALTQLLSRVTSMPVREATNNLRVDPNHVYIIPPNTTLSIAQGVLKLRPGQKNRTPARSIDSFFESLAQDQRECAIGVVLSGTASDGTLGLEAIKAEGGITFAQDDSARYDSMPRSAISVGCVDFVLKPEDIAKELACIAKHPFVAGHPHEFVSLDNKAIGTADQEDQTPLPSSGARMALIDAGAGRGEIERHEAKPQGNAFKKILLLLRTHSDVDFSLYKSTTIHRRITRRMVLSKQETLDGYAAFLRGNTQELDALYSDVLISVSSFFRNPEAFDVLKRKVFPRLLQRRGDEPIRIWILGCSTGQEAYSIVMTYLEAVENAPRARPLQVFATDLNDALLDKARQALYAKTLAQDVSPERRRRFFVQEEGGYRVAKPLREMVVFARQNLISDPPFSRIDLISCRNLMIYLDPGLQKKVMPSFHYALNTEGFLFLGASESIGTFTDLFEPVDRKHKIFVRKAGPAQVLHLPFKSRRPGRLPSGRRGQIPVGKGRPEPLEGFRGELNAQREADRVSVKQFAPPGVLINAELQILQFRGRTEVYLQPPPTGKASFDILKMAREGLMLPLRVAINKARKDNKPTRKNDIRLQQNGRACTVNLEVIPLRNLRERCFLVLFENAEQARRAALTAPAPGPSNELPAAKKQTTNRLNALETELAETRDYLQSVQEQAEAAHEELQASNEEVQSANEELQSINEELETSKEELESANEELLVVNEEMANRNTELNRLNADLTNLQASTRLPILLLGRDLTIRRFSASAEKRFNLLATDLGRPLSAVRHGLLVPSVPKTPYGAQPSREHAMPFPVDEFVREVIDTVQEQEREALDKGGRWYSIRARPYMTVDNKVDGAVLVLMDITELKRIQHEVALARDHAEATIRTAREPFIVLRGDLTVERANDAFYKTFKVTPQKTQNVLIYELAGGQWNIPQLRDLLEGIIRSNSFFNDFEVIHDFEQIGRRTMLLNARRLDNPAGEPEKILLGIQDITRSKETGKALKISNDQLAAELAGLQRLQEVSTLLIQGGDIVTLYEQIVNAAIALMSAEMGSMQKFHPGRQELWLLAWKGFDAESAAVWERVYPTSVSACGVALRTGQRVIVPDVEACEFMAATQDLEAYRKSGIRAVQSTPLLSRPGKIVGMLSTHWREPHQPSERELRLLDVLARQAADLIERSETEQARANLASIVEFSDDAIISKDLNGVITSWNQGAERLFGYTAAEAVGQPVTLLIPGDRVNEEPKILERIRRAESVEHYETVRQCKDGVPIDVSLTVSPIKNDQGQVVGASSIARDITQRKRTEASLLKAQAQLADRAGHLEQAVSERTAELTATNKQLEAFIYSVAHDLRAPLRAMQGFAFMLAQEAGAALSQTGRKYAERINTSAQFMDSLLIDLLAFSRLSQQHVELQAVNLENVITSVLARLDQDIRETSARVEASGPWPIVLAHEPLLAQVLFNLISNALKFVVPGITPVVRIRAEQQSDFIRVWVEDNGIGIDPRHQEQIFRLFNRLHGEKYPGTGIGLAIVEKGVERMGGRAGVESLLDDGSRFWIDLRKAPGS